MASDSSSRTTMTPSSPSADPDTLDYASFVARIDSAASALEARKSGLEALGRERDVLVYSFGACGSELARQLARAGVHCTIHDRSPAALERARAAGFDTTTTLPTDRPILVGAGQNQLAILDALQRPAWSLVESLYAYDLISSYGPVRAFCAAVSRQRDALHAVYLGLEPDSRREFLDVLEFRASLDVRRIGVSRTPVSEMWVPPAAVCDIESFCDVGAYDGDTLMAMKKHFPGLRSTLAIEPGRHLHPTIDAVAARLGLDNRSFHGAAWNRAARLSARTLPSGMMSITEHDGGDIEADALDHVAGGNRFDYIKFDVEGSESRALEGARALVRSARCIAFAAYHLPGDLVDLPAQMRGLLGSDARWRWSFHHYSECFEDSIFYAWRTPSDG